MHGDVCCSVYEKLALADNRQQCHPYKHFHLCRDGLPAAMGGIVEAKVATHLHPALYDYKHNTSGPPEGPWRPATLWRPGTSHPLGGTEVGCKVGLRTPVEAGLL